MGSNYAIVLITTPKEKAKDIARFIVEEKLGACVNIVSKVESIYWWKGQIETSEESLLIVKTLKEKIVLLIEKVKAIHPYTIPEIISVDIETGIESYLKWIEDSIG
jgi:periplasmic divalent cation tolerance protein